MGGLYGSLQQKQIPAEVIKTLYVQLATILLEESSVQEGVNNTISLLITGGNSYTSDKHISLVSATSHRGIVHASRKRLIGDVEIGYCVYGRNLEIWLVKPEYNHHITASIIGITRGNLVTNIVQSEKPDGYTVIE